MAKLNPKSAEFASSDVSSISAPNPDESTAKVTSSASSTKKKRYDKVPASSAGTTPGAQGMIDSDDEYDGKCYVLDDREPGDVPESDFLKFMQRSRKSTADKNIVLDMEDEEGDLPIEDDVLAASVVAVATAEAPSAYYIESEGGAGEAGSAGDWSYVDEDPMRSYEYAISSEAAEGDITKFRRVSASSSEAGAATSSSSITSTIRSSQFAGPTAYSTFGSSTSYWSAFPSSEKYALFGLTHTTSPGASGTATALPPAAIATPSTVSSKLPEKQLTTMSKSKTVSATTEKLDKKPAPIVSDKKATVDKKPAADKKSGKVHKYEIPKFTGKKTPKAAPVGAGKTSSRAEILVERMSSKRV